MKDEVIKIILALKAMGVSVSKIEKDLGLYNGTVGKVSKGLITLPPEKMKLLSEYFKEKTGLVEIPKEDKTSMVVDDKKLNIIASNEVKEKLRESVININKDFGDGAVMLFGDKPNNKYTVISTGSLLLDDALGIGGLPKGRFVEIYGSESSGKTTIALHVIANAQKKGLKCFYVDAENAFDPEYASKIGVNIDELLYCQPDYGEQGLEIIDRYILSGDANVVVVDSVAALVPKAELEGEMGDSKMGLQARLMSQACRKLVNSVAKMDVLIIWINQIRNKIGVTYGNPEITTGGMALQFYSSIRLSVSRSISKENSIISGDIIEGNKTIVKVIKNKCSPPFKKAEFNIIYGVGIDRISELIDLGVQKGIINKTGGWYSYNGSKLGQGKEMVKSILIDNEELKNEIENKISHE